MSDNSNLQSPQLPPTWAMTTLGAVVAYGRTNKAEPSDMKGTDWVLELEDIEKDSSRLLGRLTFADRQSKSTKNRFEAGDVLYGKLRPYLNKVLIADQPGFCTTEIVPIQPGEHLDARYLFYWLKHPVFLKYVEAESHGMNMPRLGTDAGRAAPFVLAPRAQQTRIADQLDTLLARVNACNDHLDAIPGILKRFRKAMLRYAVTGELSREWRDTQPEVVPLPRTVIGLILKPGFGLSR
ncbi:restriction endonuclease subunit S [Paracidovorax avenae]|uniref:restriction endonuclease subunit S n=1 Tax=Paracidovorax avenae TaxID=80867 RepID=UPI001AD834DB|nr:restriction endonuclease subunit S [Paracidovorax avenae]